MVLTYSAMLPLDTLAPDSTLSDVVTQKSLTLSKYIAEKKPAGFVIVFMCNHCPFVKHILPVLLEKITFYKTQNILFIGISANDIEAYPDDSPDNMRKLAMDQHFDFPYLFDAAQETAKKYQAACTPDFYLFNDQSKCVYRGRFDASTPGNGQPVTGKDLSDAIENLLAGKPLSSDQKPSQGCNIKWRDH